MLSKSSVSRLFFCISIALILASCQPKEDNGALASFDQTLQHSSRVLKESNKLAYEAIRRKHIHQYAASKAALYVSSSEKVLVLSEKMYTAIDSLKSNLKNKEPRHERCLAKFGDTLYRQVVTYCRNVLQVFDTAGFSNNPAWKTYLMKEKEKRIDKYSTLFHISMKGEATDSIPLGWYKSFLFENEEFRTLVMLSKLQLDVLTVASELLSHCYEANSMIEESFTYYSVIATMNTSCVKAGQTIEVIAGLGKFSADASPKVMINGVVHDIAIDGSAVYKFKAEGKPGKYTLPVSISFVKADSSIHTLNRTLEYIIAD
ncbi:hypothetical protein [Paraflavitalea sp. CAU 1676]|uniref:hypothetical protein n=1 Tax=Paraflavitalea sp. CAU 1676 TaxID=3032598 RepID=UPI0023DACA4B|nr:hypothetical protein [Paraflavitalea sp. CAU 1676]MDF2189070.1 hypothetical protein [Paraflavitalea sp. CAU 1676]